MLTGDAEESAKAVAGAVGIREVHAGLLPQQKLARLQSIRETKGAAMFVGDGINDAPVLAGADVGAAMGSGADAAIEAADVVFMTSDVAAVPQALRISRQTARIAWQNVVFALAVKLAVMILGLCGYASMWLAVSPKKWRRRLQIGKNGRKSRDSRNNHQNSAPKIVEYAELSKKQKFQLHFWMKCAMMLTWKRWNRFQTTIRLCRNENRRKHK